MMPVGGAITRVGLKGAVLLCMALLLCAVPSHAADLRGIALVIGNGEYEHLSRLSNPDNDAKAVEGVFTELGFDTVARTDRDRKQLSRDLERFAEDAEETDVAILYYSGHGIEAGGENYLVPVDADVSALDSAAEDLVDLTAFIADLKSKAPLVIVMLDACRTNPFPAGATLTKDDGESVSVAAAGLSMSDARGAVSLSAPVRAAGILGTVIGFAAEPGKVALDGDPGGNSPYAAAVTRHLSAMAGAEFGTVMRMITEEVYLKTGGRQRPWVNESLSRLLYFGETPDGPDGTEGDILKERRQLLLTISALPDPEKRTVERAARAGDVPMDALYAMLRTLGADTTNDPPKLEQALLGQTERLKGILAERRNLNETDAELLRLSGLAQQAIQEGALTTALKIHEQIKTRVASLSQSLELAESALKARHIEFARAYADSAQSYALAFDYIQAAADYEKAYEEVRRWDDILAWRYRSNQAEMLSFHANVQGDKASAERGVALAREALSLSEHLPDRGYYAQSQNALGRAFSALAQHDTTTDSLTNALVAFVMAQLVYTREAAPVEWAGIEADRGLVLLNLGLREMSNERVEEAADAYRASMTVYTRDQYPDAWAWSQWGLGNALNMIGTRGGGQEPLRQSLAAYENALSIITRDRNAVAWSAVATNYAFALGRLGRLTAGSDDLLKSVGTYRAVLEPIDRAKLPLAWAEAKSRLAEALTFLGERTGDPATLQESYTDFTEALEEYSYERAPFGWAATLANRATTISVQGEIEGDASKLERAIADYERVAAVITRDIAPFDWGTLQTKLGRALGALAEIRDDQDIAVRAAQAHINAVEQYDAGTNAFNRADALQNLGMVVLDLAAKDAAGPWIDYALNAFGDVRSLQPADKAPQLYTEATRLLAMAKILDGERSKNREAISDAIALLDESGAYFKANAFNRYDAYFRDTMARAVADLKAIN